MPNVQRLTAGLDDLNGIGGDPDVFQLTPATLQATDTVTGGATSPFVDNLEVSATGTLAAAPLQGVTGVEQLILSSTSNDVTLTMAWSPARAPGTSASRAGRATTSSTQASSPTSRRFPSSPAPATTASRAAIAAAIGLAANALASADTVVGRTAADFLYFLTAGAIAVDALAKCRRSRGSSSIGQQQRRADRRLGVRLERRRVSHRQRQGDGVVDASTVSAKRSLSSPARAPTRSRRDRATAITSSPI